MQLRSVLLSEKVPEEIFGLIHEAAVLEIKAG